jgi:hypothetical protein
MTRGAFDDLTLAQQVLLLAWRRGGARGGSDPCVHTAWRVAAGDGGGRCLHLFRRLVDRIGAHARRPLALAPARATWLTRDERCLLDLVSACQRDLPQLAVPLARWLVRAPEHVSVLAIAAGLGHAMEAAGLSLCAPAARPAAVGACAPQPARAQDAPGAVA